MVRRVGEEGAASRKAARAWSGNEAACVFCGDSATKRGGRRTHEPSGRRCSQLFAQADQLLDRQGWASRLNCSSDLRPADAGRSVNLLDDDVVKDRVAQDL